MSRKTKYFTGLTIVMLVFSAGLAIPTLIEGINIGMNVTSFYGYNERIESNEFIIFNSRVSNFDRINIDFNSEIYNSSIFDNDAPIIVAIMDGTEFDAWENAGYPEPQIANTTHFYNIAEADLVNIDMETYTWETAYFIIYNNNAFDVEFDYEILIIPWGHIIPTAVTGFLFSLFFTIFITKLLSAAYFNGIYAIKGKKYGERKEEEKRAVEITRSQETVEMEGNFCQSCGTPITPKDGKYCPQCGASI